MVSKSRLQRIVDAMIELDRMWGKGSIGVLLADAYFSENKYLTADSLAARMGVSDDSARRWLDDLVAKKSAVLEIDRGRRFYRTTRQRAEQTLNLIAAVDNF